jgi:hypothetical protein
VEIRKIKAQGQPGAIKVAWWYRSVIPATEETYRERSWFEAGPGQTYKTLSEKELKQKGLGTKLKW